MLPSEYLPLWREYVTAFGELLEPAVRDPGFPAAQRLVRVPVRIHAISHPLMIILLAKHTCILPVSSPVDGVPDWHTPPLSLRDAALCCSAVLHRLVSTP